MKAGSILSRRVSEFFGVALFAVALLWLISLATYEASDPVWFFSAGSGAAPANFAGRVGAFMAELSFQLFGYASYLLPAVFVVIGWHSFWCRALDAENLHVAHLQLHAPSLDDVFLAKTGRTLEGAAAEAEPESLPA